jgi:hypothetical protein
MKKLITVPGVFKNGLIVISYQEVIGTYLEQPNELIKSRGSSKGVTNVLIISKL